MFVGGLGWNINSGLRIGVRNDGRVVGLGDLCCGVSVGCWRMAWALLGSLYLSESVIYQQPAQEFAREFSDARQPASPPPLSYPGDPEGP